MLLLLHAGLSVISPLPLTVIVPSASSVQIRLSSVHVCVPDSVPAPASSALAVIPHEIFCRVSVGKYSSVPTAMTAADERAASRFHCFVIFSSFLFECIIYSEWYYYSTARQYLSIEKVYFSILFWKIVSFYLLNQKDAVLPYITARSIRQVCRFSLS